MENKIKYILKNTFKAWKRLFFLKQGWFPWQRTDLKWSHFLLITFITFLLKKQFISTLSACGESETIIVSCYQFLFSFHTVSSLFNCRAVTVNLRVSISTKSCFPLRKILVKKF